MPRPGTTFLEDPTPNQLLRAVASNHRWWMIRSTRSAGGEVRRQKGVAWVYTPSPGGEVAIPFPHLSGASPGDQLDDITSYYRARRPVRGVTFWSLDPPKPSDLAARLAARGFEWSFRPHWMWLDLGKMRTYHPEPAGVRIEPVEDEAPWDVEDLPYYSRDAVAHQHALRHMRPRRVWRFGAWLDGRIAGHATLHLTTGRLGVAGIYSVGVVPAARNRGIGVAVTLAVCELARQLGCRHALLNSTEMGERVYGRIGFESLGYGQTWFLSEDVLTSEPPTRTQVAFVEAVGRGDIGALDSVGRRMSPHDLDAPLPAGLTPVQLAARTSQPASAEWLSRHGATLDVLSVWDLGWKDRALRLLAGAPELANRRSGKWQTTPLHEATLRDDTELTRILLAAGSDLEAQDAEFHSTPLGWAQHMQRTEIMGLIGQHLGKVRSG